MTVIQRALRAARSDWSTHAFSVVSAALAFSCLAFVLLLVVNLTSLQAKWERVGHLSAYLGPRVTNEEVARIVDALRATRGVAAVRHISAGDARAELLAATSVSLLEALPAEAFPVSLEIDLTDSSDPQRATAITQVLRNLPAIESIETYEAWTIKLARLAHSGAWVATLLALVVFAGVATVVASAARLMVERRRSQLEALRLVGATEAYLRRPFVLEGAAQGAIGALGALLVSGVIFLVLRHEFDDQVTLLLGLRPSFLPWSMGLSLVALGAMLGAGAALLGVMKSAAR